MQEADNITPLYDPLVWQASKATIGKKLSNITLAKDGHINKYLNLLKHVSQSTMVWLQTLDCQSKYGLIIPQHWLLKNSFVCLTFLSALNAAE